MRLVSSACDAGDDCEVCDDCGRGCTDAPLAAERPATPATAPADPTTTTATTNANPSRALIDGLSALHGEWLSADVPARGNADRLGRVLGAMPSYRDLLKQAKREIREVDTAEAEELR